MYSIHGLTGRTTHHSTSLQVPLSALESQTNAVRLGSTTIGHYFVPASFPRCFAKLKCVQFIYRGIQVCILYQIRRLGMKLPFSTFRVSIPKLTPKVVLSFGASSLNCCLVIAVPFAPFGIKALALLHFAEM